eukprot:376539_1
MYEWFTQACEKIPLDTVTTTIKSFIETNVNIDTIQAFENSSKSQLATLFCTASVASTLGIHLYSKYQDTSKYKYCSASFNYNNYKRILRASAPGKIILSGEHAVVYGIKSVSTAINKRTYVTIYEPIDIHRVINLREKPSINNNSQSPTNSTLILKLEHAILSWKISDLIAIHNLNINKWDYKLIQNKYHLLKPHISFTDNINIELIQTHPLYGQKDWDTNITSVLLLLLFQCFNTLFNDQIFISYGIAIDVKSDIPIGSGLGSSSAWSTAISAALYYYWIYVTAGQRKTKVISSGVQTTSRIWKLSYESEKINHGIPSGIDNTTSIYGGYIKYKNKDNFNVIDINKQFIHRIPLLVINTNVKGRNTKKLVHSVKHLYNKYEKIINPMFNSIEKIGDELIEILQNENISSYDLYKNINELFCINHGLLISIGVGHNVINSIQNICNQYNLGKGFKITGAGGGGSVIVSLLNRKKGANICDNNMVDHKIIDRLRKKLASKGYESYLIQTGQHGMLCKFY